MHVRKVMLLVNKTEIRRQINKWLKEVKLNEGEELSIITSAEDIRIGIWDYRNLEYRKDPWTKQEEERRRNYLIQNRRKGMVKT